MFAYHFNNVTFKQRERICSLWEHVNHFGRHSFTREAALHFKKWSPIWEMAEWHPDQFLERKKIGILTMYIWAVWQENLFCNILQRGLRSVWVSVVTTSEISAVHRKHIEGSYQEVQIYWTEIPEVRFSWNCSSCLLFIELDIPYTFIVSWAVHDSW